MAFPAKRAANRRAAQGHMQDGGEGRMGQMGSGGRGYDGGTDGGRSRMMGHKMHGSPASVGASKGRGPEPGAGELITPHNGPGAAARRYAGMDKTMYPSRPTPPGTPSGHMDVYPEGSPSNKSR